jgi:hypothetical protein
VIKIGDEVWDSELGRLKIVAIVVGHRPDLAERLDEEDPIQSLAYDPERYPHCIEIDARQ